MTKRDERLPRVSSLIYPLIQEELESIPRDTLEKKAAEGRMKHRIIETSYGKNTDNIISWLFIKGLAKIFDKDSLMSKPTFEQQLNGKRFTGRPDFLLNKTLSDYKFTDVLKDETGLQLIKYGILEREVNDIEIERYFAFHYPVDYSLFIYEVSQRAIDPLKKFSTFLVDNHDAIREGGFEKYEAINEWGRIKLEYEIFELVDALYAPHLIEKANELEKAVVYYNFKQSEKFMKKLKSDITRYMIDNNIQRIDDNSGYGIKLKSRTNKKYDKKRAAMAKEKYKKELENCIIDREKTTFIECFKPRAKKPKQIN
jgi:hypothetical protein